MISISTPWMMKQTRKEAVTYLCWSSSRGFVTSGLSLEFGASGGASLGCSIRDVDEGAGGLLAGGWAGEEGVKKVDKRLKGREI